MQRQPRAEAPRERKQVTCQLNLLFRRQILIAQARPAASGRERGAENIGERRCRLLSIRDEEE